MKQQNKPAYRIPSMVEIAELPLNGQRVVSLFSGCGGSSLGYRMAGFCLISKLGGMVRSGGAIIVVDKCEAVGGYAGTVLWRLALAGKMATGVDPSEIVAKELSLMGVQRPFDPAMLELAGKPIEFLRFGEFAGWLVEKR